MEPWGALLVSLEGDLRVDGSSGNLYGFSDQVHHTSISEEVTMQIIETQELVPSCHRPEIVETSELVPTCHA